MAVDNLHILGRPWTVEWVDDLGNNFGECWQEHGTIKVISGLDSYMDRTTLLMRSCTLSFDSKAGTTARLRKNT